MIALPIITVRLYDHFKMAALSIFIAFYNDTDRRNSSLHFYGANRFQMCFFDAQSRLDTAQVLWI